MLTRQNSTFCPLALLAGTYGVKGLIGRTYVDVVIDKTQNETSYSLCL